MPGFLGDLVVSILIRFTSALLFVFIVGISMVVFYILSVLVMVVKVIIPDASIPYILVGIADAPTFFIRDPAGGAAILIPKHGMVYLLSGLVILYFLLRMVVYRQLGLLGNWAVLRGEAIGFLLNFIMVGFSLALFNVFIAFINAMINPGIEMVDGFVLHDNRIPAYLSIPMQAATAFYALVFTTPVGGDAVVGFGIAVFAYLVNASTILVFYLFAMVGAIFAPIVLLRMWLLSVIGQIGFRLENVPGAGVPKALMIVMSGSISGGLLVWLGSEFFASVVRAIYRFALAVSNANFGIASGAMKGIVDALSGDAYTRARMGLDGLQPCNIQMDCASELLSAAAFAVIGIIIGVLIYLQTVGALAVLGSTVRDQVSYVSQKSEEIRTRLLTGAGVPTRAFEGQKDVVRQRVVGRRNSPEGTGRSA